MPARIALYHRPAGQENLPLHLDNHFCHCQSHVLDGECVLLTLMQRFLQGHFPRGKN